MLERSFDLVTTPELKRYYLHCNYSEEKHIVTMSDVENMFKDNSVELIRVKNNRSILYFLEEIFD